MIKYINFRVLSAFMVDKVSIPQIDSRIIQLYALKDFVKSQQPIIEEELVKQYAGFLEKYIEKHENDIGGRSYSIWKRLSKHPKFLKPTLRIYLNKGDFNDYWSDCFKGIVKEIMPDWVGLLAGDIAAVYNGLKDTVDINSAFVERFDKKNIAAEMSRTEALKTMEDYLVDESVYSKYKEEMSLALDRYNMAAQALTEYMGEIGVDSGSTDEATDAVKISIDKSNEILKNISCAEDRETVLQGALLLEEHLDDLQRAINVCLTGRDENCEFDNLYLRNLDTGRFMGMLCRLNKVDAQEFKIRALESLGYEIEGVDHSVYPYAPGVVAVRKVKKQ